MPDPIDPSKPEDSCTNPVPDGDWGPFGPNQAVDCAQSREDLSERLFRGHVKSGVNRQYGGVIYIN